MNQEYEGYRPQTREGAAWLEAGAPDDAVQAYEQLRLQAGTAAARARIPELARPEVELSVAEYIASDAARLQRYQRLYQADVEGALTWAWGEFQSSAGSAAAGAVGARGGGKLLDPGLDLRALRDGATVEQARQAAARTSTTGGRVIHPELG